MPRDIERVVGVVKTVINTVAAICMKGTDRAKIEPKCYGAAAKAIGIIINYIIGGINANQP
jgi:hypothetical protein